jgi:serine protease Do
MLDLLKIRKILKMVTFSLIILMSGVVGGFVALNLNSAYSKDVSVEKQYTTATNLVSTLGSSQASQQISVSSQPIVNVVKNVSKSVVGITSKQSVSFSRRSQKTAQQAIGTGSGIIIDSKGYIVTNNHVIESADSVTVTLSNGKEVAAQVIGKDSRTDLAVLKVNETGLVPAELGDSSVVQTGELAFAIGNPLGLELAGSVTMGIVSGIGRTLSVDGNELNFIQTDAAINPGNSGGPLINQQGQVIGINTMKEVSAGVVNGVSISAEGIGFAIPISEAKKIINELITNGNISRPGLGVSIYEITEQQAQQSNIPQGIYIASVVKGGPAEKAGILSGDILTGIQGKSIKTAEELTKSINSHKIGDEIKITIWREGREITIKVKLGELTN